jgi:HTH-type transcriptional regulator/antitoxin HigA
MPTETLNEKKYAKLLTKLLAVLISEYEKKRCADLFAEKASPADVLAFLMEENHLTQKDFSPIPQSRMSDIMAGKRKISMTQARVFGERFKVNPVLFLYPALQG